MNAISEQSNIKKLTAGYSVQLIRKDFPILDQKIQGFPLSYLDNAASSQKPLAVINAIENFYRHDYANVHRGIHTLSERSTTAYESARQKVKMFINAAHKEEIVFVRGTTEAINLVAQSYARPHLRAGDEIIISTMEHHSNIVPWQLLAEQTGAKLKVAPINEAGELEMDKLTALFNTRTRLLAITHISNVLGTINPLCEIITAAHAHKVMVLVDGAQAVPHLLVDVQALDCDFYAFSAHKMYGPSGIGVLYGKQQLLESMPPYQAGGEMIKTVSFEKSTFAELPHKFEAGTPHIAGAVGLGAAIDYLTRSGMQSIAAYEHQLLQYATEALNTIKGLKIIGQARHKASIVSFVLDGLHPHDIATILDQYGVAVRAGHHCAMPLINSLGISATTRASLALYNTTEEIDRLVLAIEKAREFLT